MRPVILSLYPNSIGIGYACLQIPESLIDFGIAKVTPLSNGKLLGRMEKFMDFYKPKVIVLKEAISSNRTARVDRLIAAIATLAGEKDIEVFSYGRQQIGDVFETFGCTSKYQMVEKIVTMLPGTATRARRQRKWYEKEDYNMGIFDSLSLAITHAYLSE
jgi:Holliday junction resolvasome RuvABC endonuclease subunit